jgi:membrane glycosyltransferase
MSEAVPEERSLDVPALGLRRVAYFALVVLSAVAGTLMMLDIVGAGGVTALEILILVLFAPTFTWISFSFWNAIIGFALVMSRRHPLSLRPLSDRPSADTPLTSRTALVMPARNEDPGRVFDGLRGLLSSLEATGRAGAFDLHLLSDTSDPVLARAEEAGWETFARAYRGSAGLHYRRRSSNEGRKAGNIGEFCRRCERDYDFMIVLDADSVMRGRTLVQLVRTMEANPGAALIQTVPLPARQSTVFGRLVQFAATMYSPMLAAGQSFWQGDAANYWGHNAILRLAPFVRHARLPTLPGRAPLGGEILSHDFVEAALLRRAGWGVYLLPDLPGSYEDVPTNVLDFARRDRRWAQGSIQHLRLLTTRGLHPLSRVHFTLGAMGYVSSVLWFVLLLAGSAYVLWPGASGGPTLAFSFGAPSPASAGWSASLLAITGMLLFLPKVLGVIVALREPTGYGGALRMLAGSIVEALFAIVIAPMMMMFHVASVLAILAGRDVSWGAQPRGARRVGWPEALGSAGWIGAGGAVWLAVTAALSPGFVLWLAPILVGLLLAAPLARWTSGTGHAGRTGQERAERRNVRWLTVPQEMVPLMELDGRSGSGVWHPEHPASEPAEPLYDMPPGRRSRGGVAIASGVGAGAAVGSRQPDVGG